ncbi:MAG TPA: hypothetical protein VK137_11000, partial [Planctomycetaceae bacterium]|nr:hypothetical protein [Planctomycetaceae bacterium]
FICDWPERISPYHSRHYRHKCRRRNSYPFHPFQRIDRTDKGLLACGSRFLRRDGANDILEELLLRVVFADRFPANVGEIGILEEGGVDFFDGEQRAVERRIASVAARDRVETLIDAYLR